MPPKGWRKHKQGKPKPERVIPYPPRYDEVFAEGTRQLEETAKTDFPELQDPVKRAGWTRLSWTCGSCQWFWQDPRDGNSPYGDCRAHPLWIGKKVETPSCGEWREK